MRKFYKPLLVLSLLFSGCDDKIALLPEPTAAPITIGQSVDGGTVFYVDASGQHGLTAATSDISSVGPGFYSSGSTTINDLSTAYSSISVGSISASYSVLSVNVNISHTYDGDLIISLQAPNGSNILLCNRRGGAGQNFSNTTFMMGYGSITSGSAPFNGYYTPEQPLSSLTGTPTGTWTLIVSDNANGDSGVINSWSLAFGFSQYNWSNGSSALTGANGTAVGTGSSNTSTIVGMLGTANYAASLCNQMGWHLPSSAELSLLQQQQSVVGGFSAVPYWSSSEYSGTMAYMVNFGSSSAPVVANKSSTYRVRPVRSF
jgi:subtilisin-like proprotein convertase family protein